MFTLDHIEYFLETTFSWVKLPDLFKYLGLQDEFCPIIRKKWRFLHVTQKIYISPRFLTCIHKTWWYTHLRGLEALETWIFENVRQFWLGFNRFCPVFRHIKGWLQILPSATGLLPIHLFYWSKTRAWLLSLFFVLCQYVFFLSFFCFRMAWL